MNNKLKNILVYSFAAASIGMTLFLIHRRDAWVMNKFHRGPFQYDSTAFRPTEAEHRIAMQFSDSTLPQLKKLGLIKSYTRTEIETIITISGRIWKQRSGFFKKSLLDQIFIYNKVNGFPVNVRIVDNENSRLYAEITPPDRRIIY